MKLNIKDGLVIGVLIVLGGLIGLKKITDSEQLKKAQSIPLSKAQGEARVLELKSIAEVYKEMDIKSPPELLRREISLYTQSPSEESLKKVQDSISVYKESLKGKSLALVDYGRLVRLGRLLYELELIKEARSVLNIALKEEVPTYGLALLKIRDYIQMRPKFDMHPEQLEEVLSILVLNNTLEMGLPVKGLIEESLASVNWDNLSEGPEVGKVYILQLMGLYSGQDYYQSGLHKKLYRHWSKHKDKKEYMASPRMKEAYMVFKSLEGQDLE